MNKKSPPTQSSPSPFWNSDAFYKVVRLKTGELLLCTMHEDAKSVQTEAYVTLINPVQAVPTKEITNGNNVLGMAYALKNFMDICSNDEYTLDTQIVCTIGDMSVCMKEQYQDHLNVVKMFEQQVRQRAEDILREQAIAALLIELSSSGSYQILNDEAE